VACHRVSDTGLIGYGRPPEYSNIHRRFGFADQRVFRHRPQSAQTRVSRRNAPYQAYRAGDGWFAVAAGNNKLWQQVCELTPALELMDDARFSTPTLRAANQAALAVVLEARFVQLPVAHWLDTFGPAGVPSAPINGYAEALADPQAQYLELVQPMTLPNGVQTRTVGCPVKIDGAVVAVNTRPPALGEHTEQVLASLAGASGTVN
jgi:crotonobetainyl-CoA:carnitine CoA-transferase CaiB-like acyl-CoA transferase